MIAASASSADWRAALPPLRGRVTPDAPLAPYTWFRVGGPAELLFRPADEEDLAAFLAAVPPEVPVTVIGAGSNLLIRDGGLPGAVIRLGPAFAAISLYEESIEAGAGALDLTVSRHAEAAGLGGLEFLSGIPGTIGGAVRMNAGAFGGEIKDVIVSARVLERSGQTQLRDAAELGLGYRRSSLSENAIVLSATLSAHPDQPAAIAERMERIRLAREASQPLRVRTGGSTFANPPGESAWKLIDAAGCRGLTHGGARVSEKHCNFLINLGEATAAEIEDLGEEVRRRVLDSSGIELHWEIRRIGVRA
ncbi:UDP-N-acetylmuramate dehydrogenase [Magnetospirillum molischianum]|uniref:UDP-N-acetylenolpyruvoylglucosamine reductase n=1 Tax=Magnetospirillum molischianum DSM 120 TaxID=1150626 RepID=H8FMQ3_MAGML|nr:UDP-N-acetylmuramate dehydrogenase [Magnetospirillum molischianum]CCG39641.1 UDP-N-acetylenolpyruvoylglucosamine reductase (MurB-like) [Magnetospirillum molischianum DSM 120]